MSERCSSQKSLRHLNSPDIVLKTYLYRAFLTPEDFDRDLHVVQLSCRLTPHDLSPHSGRFRTSRSQCVCSPVILLLAAAMLLWQPSSNERMNCWARGPRKMVAPTCPRYRFIVFAAENRFPKVRDHSSASPHSHGSWDCVRKSSPYRGAEQSEFPLRAMTIRKRELGGRECSLAPPSKNLYDSLTGAKIGWNATVATLDHRVRTRIRSRCLQLHPCQRSVEL